MFHSELAQLGAELAMMCGLAGDAMENGVRAVLDADLTLAAQVIDDDMRIDALRASCEERAFELLLLQWPVARDLRLVVTGIQAAEKLERMGDLARHVAELAQRRYPAGAVPAGMTDQVAEMGRLAVRAARGVEQVIATPQDEGFAERERDDDAIDRLQRELLTTLHRRDAPYSVHAAIDVALLARFIERFADQAVSITRRLDYVVTGIVPE
jgi:phosphate transport system protein